MRDAITDKFYLSNTEMLIIFGVVSVIIIAVTYIYLMVISGV